LVLALLCAVLAGHGVSRLAADDASASPASADASTKSDGDNCVEPGEGECDDTPDEPHVHDYEWEHGSNCSCEMKDPSAEDCYPVGKSITIELPDPELTPGCDDGTCVATEGDCDAPFITEDHSLEIIETSWEVTNSDGTVAEGESSTATFTPTKPSKSKGDYTITFTVKPVCQAPHCESCELKEQTSSATFTVAKVKLISVDASDPEKTACRRFLSHLRRYLGGWPGWRRERRNAGGLTSRVKIMEAVDRVLT